MINDSFIAVGLTGATGAGKSTAAKIFEKLGCHIIDADKIGHTLYSKNSSTVKSLCAEFGSSILDTDGNINRKALAALAFAGKEAAARLNAICHPAICYKTMQIMDEIRKKEKQAIMILDAALLLESNMDILCDCTVCVTAPQGIRMRRIMRRDGITEQQALERIGIQHNSRFYKNRCDYNIDGSKTINETEISVKQILSDIKLRCKKR